MTGMGGQPWASELRGKAMREVYRRELLPVALLWPQAAAGVHDWARGIAKELEPPLGTRARPAVAELMGALYRRRYAALRRQHPWLPEQDDRAVRDLFAALTLMSRRQHWLLDDLGGAPDIRGRARGAAWVLRLSMRERWVECATHLGELLIVLTEQLPQELPRARGIVASICFAMGERYAKRVHRAFGLPALEDGGDPVELAIEILRVGEYVFHVNPDHWSGNDPSVHEGFLEGDACLWWSRPGWTRGHCGIFGQFQAGVCSVFGLKYLLDKTIPKHGGDTCRVTLTPLKRGREGLPLRA